VRRLYGGGGEGAAAWLTRHRIRYVVATPNVPAPGGPFLVERYAAGGYGVYEFVPRVVSGQNASHER
jgi:hypothetical protein